MKTLTMLPFRALLVGASVTFFPLHAGAIGASADCTSDVDCGEGGECQKAMWVDGCAPTPEGGTDHCDNSVHEAETGTCYYPPPSCTSDAECDEYMSCQSEGSTGVCYGDSEGNVYCEEEGSTSMTCLPDYGSDSCASDADCPREFECVAAPIACPACVGCECPQGDTYECRPKQIPCDSDAMCPSDWSCMGTESTSCSGGTPTEEGASGGVGGSGPVPAEPGGAEASGEGGAAAGGTSGGTPPDNGSTEDGPTLETEGDSASGGEDAEEPPVEESGGREMPGPDEQPDDVSCVTVKQTGTCYPNAWMDSGYGVDGDLATGAPGSAGPGQGSAERDETDNGSDDGTSVPPVADPGAVDEDGNAPEESGGASEEVAGCAVAHPGAPSGTAWLMALLLSVPFLRRRREAAPVARD